MIDRRWNAGRGELGLLAIVAALALASPVAARSAGTNGHIAEASARFGVPEEWIRRVISAESGGRTMLNGRPITSRAGAMGLMQLMPGTWRELRAAHGLGMDPYDPRDNIFAGTAYLRAMFDRFGYPGLFAAYNAGPNRYDESLARGRRLPAETIAYVASVGGIPPGRSARSKKSMSTIFVALSASRPARDERVSQPVAPNSLFVRLGPVSNFARN